MTRPRDESVPTPRRGDATRSDAAREARLLERRAERAANRAAELAAQAEKLRREGPPPGGGRLAGVGARDSAGQRYYYRRPLGLTDLATAAGIGLGAAVAAFYVATVLTQRTPLEDPRSARRGRSGRGTGGATKGRDAGAR